MVIECLWCGETYTFGIVGIQQVGTGHACQALVDCIEDGCDMPGRCLVERGGEQVIVCQDHADEGVFLGWQPTNLSAPGQIEGE